MSRKPESVNLGGWGSRHGWTQAGFLAIAGFFLSGEHRAHRQGVSPVVPLLLRLLPYVFGHGVQGGPPSSYGEQKS